MASAPAKKKKRKKVPPAEKPDETRAQAHSFELSLEANGELRPFKVLNATKNDQDDDVIEVQLDLNLKGEDSLRGLPYEDAYRKIQQQSAGVTEGKDTAKLQVTKSYCSVDVFLNDPLHKAQVKMVNATVKTSPRSTIVKGVVKTRVGFVGLIPAEDIRDLAKMVNRDIDLVTEPVQGELPL